MSKFKPGQQVVCIKQGEWRNSQTKMKIYNWGPRYGEIVTVFQYDPEFPDSIELVEHPVSPNGKECSFKERDFAPLMDISELTEILKHETQEV